MPYSIGNNQLPILQDNSASALNNLGDAFRMMQGGVDRLAQAPLTLKNTIQDNADEAYNAALNRYSNDPEGLAKALQNGEIDTTNVRADTLAQTQGRLKDISNSKAINYLQGRTEKANQFWDTNGTDYMQAVNDAQNGKDIGAIRAKLIASGAPAEALPVLAQLDAVDQQNWLKDYALKKQQVGAMGAALNYQKAKDEADLKGQQGIFNIRANLQKNNIRDPAQAMPIYQAIRNKDFGFLQSMGFDITPQDLTNISNSPTALTSLGQMLGFGDYSTGSSGNTSYNNEVNSTPNTPFTPFITGINATSFSKVTNQPTKTK